MQIEKGSKSRLMGDFAGQYRTKRNARRKRLSLVQVKPKNGWDSETLRNECIANGK